MLDRPGPAGAHAESLQPWRVGVAARSVGPTTQRYAERPGGGVGARDPRSSGIARARRICHRGPQVGERAPTHREGKVGRADSVGGLG
jgi:hypothetical protein